MIIFISCYKNANQNCTETPVIPTRIALIKNTITSVDMDRQKLGTLMRRRWECKWVQLLWKIFDSSLKN